MIDPHPIPAATLEALAALPEQRREAIVEAFCRQVERLSRPARARTRRPRAPRATGWLGSLDIEP